MKIPPIKQAAVQLELWLAENPSIVVFEQGGRRIFRAATLGIESAKVPWCFLMVAPDGKYLPVGLTAEMFAPEAFAQVLRDAKMGWKLYTEPVEELNPPDMAFVAGGEALASR
jgi:hypothetical protein